MGLNETDDGRSVAVEEATVTVLYSEGVYPPEESMRWSGIAFILIASILSMAAAGIVNVGSPQVL